MKLLLLKFNICQHSWMLILLSVSCIKSDDCTPNPCKHGTCLSTRNGYNWNYTCVCDEGFIGAQCQWDSPDCHDNTLTPCENDGQCVVKQDGRFCECPGSNNYTIKYGGHYCEIVNPCETCPDGTVVCQAGAMQRRGCLCLQANFKIV